MTLTVNLFDGSINASLAVGFQTVDSILIVLKRPFNAYQTNVQEVAGAITNAMAYLYEILLCLPKFGRLTAATQHLLPHASDKGDF